MRQIPIGNSLLTFLDELEFTEAALRAEPLAAEFAAVFEEEIGGWSDVFQRERTARREITRADALVAIRNGQIDATTLRFGDHCFLESGRDRKSAAFRKFFPTSPSEFVRGSLRKQAERTRDVIVPEIEKLPEGSPLRAYAAPLSEGARLALAALTARVKAEGQAATVASDVREWKEGVNRLRTTTHAELVKLAVQNRQPKSWVELFFRSAAVATAEGEEGGDPVGPTPAPEPTG